MNKKLLLVAASMLLLISTLSTAPKTQTAHADITIDIRGDPPWGDWLHYHNYTEILNTLLYLNDTFPNIVDLFPIGKSWLNQTIHCIRLTNESVTHPKPKLFFVGYHHAREPITTELALFFVFQAATDYGTNETITHMINYSEIYVVVALNVDGIEIRKQNEWQRKNAHPFDEDNDTLFDEDPPSDVNGNGYVEDLWKVEDGNWTFITWEGNDTDADGNFDWVGGVDLNRNYGYQWNATVDSGSDDPNAEDFRGLAPFSEPETQAIRDLALQNDFRYAVSFHSGAEEILYPWGYTHDPAPDDQKLQEIASNLSALTGAPYEQSAAMYTTSGSWDDWMYGNRSTFAFTCEIYENDSAWEYIPAGNDAYWERGITQAFNPDPTRILLSVQRWLPAFTYMTEQAITEAYDVAATNITLEKTTVESGSSLWINATVENHGCFEEMFNATLKANNTAVQTQMTTLANGSSTTLTFNWNTTGYTLGYYAISAYAEPLPGETDLADNTFIDGPVQIGQAPTITILLPENKTYAATSIPLNFTLNGTTFWIGYSLDGAANVTVTGNTTLTALPNDHHHVTVYANDTAGFMGASNTVYFAVDTIAPNITAVTQAPPKNNVTPQDAVIINATIIDNLSGVKQVLLNYTYTNSSGSWNRLVNMTNLGGNIWNATIPPYPYLTNVTYVMIAEDNVGNKITTEEMGYTYQYDVIPEFAIAIILPLSMLAALLAAIAYGKKRSLQTQK
jgi:hypothetical protein